jgi:F-type H+-transporting ATPase subunit a
MDFRNLGYARWQITENFAIVLNQTLIAIWIIGAVLITFAIVFRIKMRKFKDVPQTRFQNITEILVELFNRLVDSTITRRYAFFANWFFGIFLFIMLANLSSLFGLRSPTADISMTLGMGIVSLFFIIFAGIRYNTKTYLKGFVTPIFLFFPMNLMGEMAKGLSLGMRLFGNIFSGIIIATLVTFMLPRFLHVGVPGVLSIYFDVFVGLLQAYVFVILSMTFISLAAPPEQIEN